MRRETISLAVSLGLCLLAGGPGSLRALEYSYARIVRLSLVEGTVQVARAAERGWQKALVNLPLQQGDTLASGSNGRAEVEFERREVARLAANSSLKLNELALSNGGRITRLSVVQGSASFQAHASRQDSFAVQTPELTVTPIKKSQFRLDVADRRSTVRVFAGEVEVESPAGARHVKKGHELIDDAAKEVLHVEKNPPADAWDRWVASREKTIETERASAERHARAPFSYGLEDLAAFGSWYWLPGFGYGWQPSSIGAGWVPFFDGYWDFLPGLGWTWVSYEPWGWVPYHFGRWAFLPGFGWAWLPGYYEYWCPATVYWYQTGSWIGWSPLPPGTSVGQMPSAAAQLPIVTNTLAGVRGHAPNKILKPLAGTSVTLSAFAPISAGNLISPNWSSLPRLLVPLSTSVPRTLPPPIVENPRRVMLGTGAQVFKPGGENTSPGQPTPRARTRPAAREPGPQHQGPRGTLQTHREPMRGSTAQAPRTNPPPPRHQMSHFPPAPRTPHVSEPPVRPPQAQIEPRAFTAHRAEASPPHRQ